MTVQPTPVTADVLEPVVDPPFPAAFMTEHGLRWRGPAVCSLAGISYRQLDYWCRTGLVNPEGEGGGSGTQRLFTEAEIRELRLVREICDALQTNPRNAFIVADLIASDRVVALSDHLYLVHVP